MTFKYDIFISYAHLDDRNPFGDEKGWISLLHERLSVLLAQALGSELSVWRDGHNLQGNDQLQGAIGEGISNSLLLIPVISPRYVQSEWCNREMAGFCANNVSLAQAPGYRSRVFKVIKTPIPDHLKNREPQQIQNLIGYQFYGEDASDGKLHEFSSDPTDKAYWKMLSRLVSDLKETLIELKYSTPPDSNQSSAPMEASTARVAIATPVEHAGNGREAGKYIYLAETTSDLTRERGLVRDELRQRGHFVVPEQKLPLEVSEQTAAAVKDELGRCALSVHLIGTRYGSTPEDDSRSIVRIQAELAAEHANSNPAFRRLLWMPPGLATEALPISDERQVSFIKELQLRVTERAELLQTSVEDLKTRIIEKLQPPIVAPARIDRRARPKQVYLICENADRGSIRPLKEFLFRQQFEVVTWLDHGPDDKLMEYHRRNLRECDAALIYFGNGDEPWVRKNLDDLEKAYGYGREHDWVANAVYVGAPPSEQKEDFLTHMVNFVIRNFSSFDPQDLRDFISAMQAADGGH